MPSNFKTTVENIAREKNIKLASGEVAAIRDVERKLDRGEMEMRDAMKFLHGKFSFKLEDSDYREIEKSMKLFSADLERKKRAA